MKNKWFSYSIFQNASPINSRHIINYFTKLRIFVAGFYIELIFSMNIIIHLESYNFPFYKIIIIIIK